MNVEAIDWDNAPEDAQYCQDGRWYKIENDRVFTRHLIDEGAQWRESAWNVNDDLDNHSGFIKRPVSTSAETHPIEPKPPLGLTPKNIWEEQMQHQRRQDINAAMQRYIEAGKEIPNNWLEELLELNNILAKIETAFTEAIQSLPVAKDGGWIEWGREAAPDIPDDTIVEKVYSDGDVRKERNIDTFWFGPAGLNNKPYVVARYRIINEETE